MTTLTRSLLLACAALVFGASVASAQPHESRHGDHRPNAHQRHDKPHKGQRPHTKPPKHAHRPVRPDYRPGHAHGARPPAYRPPAYRPPPSHAYRGHRGAGPQHNWHRGSRLPRAYRTQHYVVNDWRGHRLYAPPRGHYWVQNGADYLLVAIATGVIAQMVLSN